MIITRIWLCAIVVLCERGKMELFPIILLFLFVEGSLGFCPSLCSCKGNKAAEGVSVDPLPGELLKIKCGGTPAQITELKEIDLSKLWTVVVSL